MDGQLAYSILSPNLIENYSLGFMIIIIFKFNLN
jgi:hypothetical protein